MIKPKLKYCRGSDTWLCRYPDTQIAEGISPQQAYQRWRINYDKQKFLETSEIKKIWPWYYV